MSETSNDFNNSNRLRYVIAPEAPHGVAPQNPTESSAPEKKNTLRNRLVGAGVVAALAISGAIVGINAASNGEKAPKIIPTSAPAAPESSASPVDTAETFTVKSLEIPSTSSPEQAAIAFNDRLTRYLMASSNPQSYKELLAYEGGTSNQFASEQAIKDSDVFNEALFINDFQSDPSLARYSDTFKTLNTSTTTDYSITAGKNPLDLEKYTISSIYKEGSTKLLSHDVNSLTMQFNNTIHNNSDKNRIGSVYDQGAAKIDGTENIFTVTFKTIDGNYKISALDIQTLVQ